MWSLEAVTLYHNSAQHQQSRRKGCFGSTFRKSLVFVPILDPPKAKSGGRKADFVKTEYFPRGKRQKGGFPPLVRKRKIDCLPRLMDHLLLPTASLKTVSFAFSVANFGLSFGARFFSRLDRVKSACWRLMDRSWLCEIRIVGEKMKS